MIANQIARLPENCRPKKQLVFGQRLIPNTNNVTRIDILPSGLIQWSDGLLADWISFDGINFPTLDSETLVLSLNPPWVPLGEPYQAASYIVESNLQFNVFILFCFYIFQ